MSGPSTVRPSEVAYASRPRLLQAWTDQIALGKVWAGLQVTTDKAGRQQHAASSREMMAKDRLEGRPIQQNAPEQQRDSTPHDVASS